MGEHRHNDHQENGHSTPPVPKREYDRVVVHLPPGRLDPHSRGPVDQAGAREPQQAGSTISGESIRGMDVKSQEYDAAKAGADARRPQDEEIGDQVVATDKFGLPRTVRSDEFSAAFHEGKA